MLGWTTAVYHHHLNWLTAGKKHLPERSVERLLLFYSVFFRSSKSCLPLFLDYPSLYFTSNNLFQNAVPMQDVTNWFMLFLYIFGRKFLSFLALHNTSFLAHSIHLSPTHHFKTCQAHQIAIRTVQYLAPYKAILQM
jgi:hypothetical protein